MKTYQVQTRAACATKEVFPCLLNTLCSKAFMASHFQFPLQECGLYPLCKTSIQGYKVAPLTQDEVLQRMKDAKDEKMTKQLAKTKGAKKGRRTTQKISRGRARTSKSKATVHEADDEDEACNDAESEEDKDTEHCFSCGHKFTDVGKCVGCDSCWRWYHYCCVRFHCLPKESKQWYCHICSHCHFVRHCRTSCCHLFFHFLTVIADR